MRDLGVADLMTVCARLLQALRHVVQQNPHILQPMLNELGKQNPQLLALINANQVRDGFPAAAMQNLASACIS